MNADETRDRAAALRAEADALERQDPLEYPKMVLVGGVQKIVNNAAEEAALAPPPVPEPVADADDDVKRPKIGKKK